MRDLTLENAVEAGGWDARYSVALAVSTDGDIAAALIDTNGDGGSIDLDCYFRGPDGHWAAQGSGGGAGDSGVSVGSGMAAIYGRTTPCGRVLVDYDGTTRTVVADGLGWWLWVAKSRGDDVMPSCRSAG